MQKPTLLILAAGMGSRYGGIKQLDQFGPNGETIIDYSLFDAIRAGFGKIVFIIREELKADFEETFGHKLKGKIDYEYAIQGVQSYVPEELGTVSRTKPWGTGHATLCAWKATKTPFAVINADDFYGQEAFEIMANFLKHDCTPNLHSMVGYQIKNTLSENGSVSRGVCEVNAEGNLDEVIERIHIIKEDEKIVYIEKETKTELTPNTIVSMNFWGFHNSVFADIEKMFIDYSKKNLENPKAEFFIPLVMSNLIDSKKGNCRVFSNESAWFGVTYPEDKPDVIASIRKVVNEGKYPNKLF
jgi:dTDP-glucose pyrophosphorylase